MLNVRELGRGRVFGPWPTRSSRTDARSAAPNGAHPHTENGSQQSSLPRFASLRVPIVIGLLAQLAIAPFTSLPGDVALWLQSTVRAMQGVGLYQLPGFSYPPLYGYWTMALGGAAHLLGIPASSLGGTALHVQAAAAYSVGNTFTTPMFTLFLKLPLIAASFGTGWCIWRIACRMGVNERQAKAAFIWWFFNPLVVFEVAIHGQIDVLAAFAVALAVLAALEDRWMLAGAAIAFGAAAKISPAFLIIPLVGYILAKADRRLRSLAAMGAGVLGVGVLLFGPMLGSGFVQNVFTREGTGGGFGGLNPLGLLTLSPLGSAHAWVSSNFVTLQHASLVVELAAAVAAGIWCWKAGRPSTVVLASLGALGAVVMLNLVTNPQYLLWILPFVALGAGGVLGHRRLYQAAIGLLAVGGIGYVLALFGWALLLAPASFAFGWPTGGLIVGGLSDLAGRSNVPLLPGTLGADLAVASCVVALAGVVCLAVTMIRSRGVDAHSRRAPTPAWTRRSFGLFAGLGALVLAIIEGAAIAAPGLAIPQAPTATVSATGSSEAHIRIVNPSHANLTIGAFAVSGQDPIHNVLFYRSTSRPDSGADDGIVLGTQQMLAARLSAAGLDVAIRTVGGNGLPSALAADHDPKSTLLVDSSGTLPDTVWGPSGHGTLRRWIDRGGVLAFSGDIPGYYAVAPGPNIGVVRHGHLVLAPNAFAVGKAELVPDGVINGPSDWQRPALTQPSSWAKDLGLSYSQDAVDVSNDAVLFAGGKVLGDTGSGRASEVFVPVGKGGVVVFAGPTSPEESGISPLANDLVHLVGTNWFAARGTSVGVHTSAGSTELTLRVPKGATGIQVVAFKPNLDADWLWTKNVRWPAQ